MKEFVIPNLYLGNISLEEAFHKVFGPDTMRKIHGEEMTLTPWNHKHERTFKFYVDIPQVPKEIKSLFCGNRLQITTKQQRIDMSDCIQIKNKVKLHVLGAELVSIKPSFNLYHILNQTYLSVNIEHRARFPPPINSILEGFMVETSKKAFQTFVHVITNK